MAQCQSFLDGGGHFAGSPAFVKGDIDFHQAVAVVDFQCPRRRNECRVIEVDAINPQLAARLARALDHWRRLAEPYRTAAEEALKRVAARGELSDDVREIITRALQD